MKILVIEDDLDLNDSLSRWLRSDRFVVESATSGASAEQLLNTSGFDLIVLDWELPDTNGIEICRKMRAQGLKTPVLMLTGRGATADKIAGLDSGADDYLTKPFELEELSARIRSLLRRQYDLPPSLVVADISLDSFGRIVNKSGKDIRLLPKEFDLLEFFMRHPNEVFSADCLLSQLWQNTGTTTEAVTTCIKRIRQKLDDDLVIRTVHGVGYKMLD